MEPSRKHVNKNGCFRGREAGHGPGVGNSPRRRPGRLLWLGMEPGQTLKGVTGAHPADPYSVSGKKFKFFFSVSGQPNLLEEALHVASRETQDRPAALSVRGFLP